MNFNTIDDLISYIRDVLKDRPEVNLIFQGEQEWSDDDIRAAITQAISWYNSIEPHGVDVVADSDTKPAELEFFARLGDIALDAVIYKLFEIGWLRNARETITSTPIATIETDKYRVYSTVMGAIYQRVATRMLEHKIAANLEGAYDILDLGDNLEDLEP